MFKKSGITAIEKVLLLSLGSLFFWVGLIILNIIITGKIPHPGMDQIGLSVLVALLSGVIATTIFLKARTMAVNATQIILVDSLQSFEVVFAFILELFFLSVSAYDVKTFVGILIVLISVGCQAYLSSFKSGDMAPDIK